MLECLGFSVLENSSDTPGSNAPDLVEKRNNGMEKILM